MVVSEGQQQVSVVVEGISAVGTENFAILAPHLSLLPLPVRALASINTDSCSCLGTSSTALSKLVQNVCILLAFCVSVGAYASKT